MAVVGATVSPGRDALKVTHWLATGCPALSVTTMVKGTGLSASAAATLCSDWNAICAGRGAISGVDP
jgi:hypothetical protein